MHSSDIIIHSKGTGKCVCTVAQYVVLEANAEVMGEAKFHNTIAPKSLNQFGHHFKSLGLSRESISEMWFKLIQPL